MTNPGRSPSATDVRIARVEAAVLATADTATADTATANTATADCLALRMRLWPGCPRDQHGAEIAALAARTHDAADFIARSADGTPLGFAEVVIRRDPVNGTEGSRIAFLEGLYVVPE